ncbi:flagellar hook-basal body complex protein [Novosphingobium sp. M1R2S20]|uniref:Flagellar hook-basal body complex protein n=1 Tax=Novosphingobium rhizovicinum TaxID=3228928 RepID=A0ABV3R973_9SPHN
MDVSSFVLLSHEQALRRRMDVVANNMANTSTAGFKREQPVFHEFVEKGAENAVDAARNVSFVLDYGAVHDTRAGMFQTTGNALDVMIEGPGYLAVEAPGGGTAYTRAGSLKVLESGDLATSAGLRILDENGQPINVPPDQTAGLKIGEDGSIVGAAGPLGRLSVTVFDNEAMVSPRGDGMMAGEGGRVLAANEARLRSGGLEGSNVEPIVETTNMVEILRSYQTSQRMSEALNEMRKRAIERLSRIG